MSIPNASRYYRLPTRMKVQLGWIMVGCVVCTVQLVSFINNRVQPKRGEQLYLAQQEKYPDGLPEHLLKQAEASRELREMTSLHNALQTPTPGETTAAMAYHFDHRRLGALRKE
jgi:hypothetical protein